MSVGTEHQIRTGIEAAKATPSVGAILLGWLHVPVEGWAVRMGLAFIVLQMAHLLWRWFRDWKHERQRDKRLAAEALTVSDRIPL